MRITKKTIKRAARTFWQALGGYIVANITIIDFTAETSILKQSLIGLIIAGIAAGFAALMNLETDGRGT